MFILSPHIAFVAAVNAMAAVSLISAGHGQKNILQDSDINRRNEFMVKSMLPGFVQLKYFKDNKGIIPLVTFIAGLILAIIGLVYVFSYDTNVHSEDFGPLYNRLMMSLYGLVICAFSSIWSQIDVNDRCNKEGMPFSGGAFETKFKNTELGMRLLVISTFAILALLTICLYFGGIL